MSENRQLKPPSLRERAIASITCLPIGNVRDNLEQLFRDVFFQLDKRDTQLVEAKKVIQVVDGLVTAKGRYHTAQWYQSVVHALDTYKAIQEGK